MELAPDFVLYPTRLSQCRWFPRQWVLDRLHATPETARSPALRVGVMVHKINEQFFQEIDPNQAELSPENHFMEIVRTLRQNMWDYGVSQDKVPIIDEMLGNFAANNAYTYRSLKLSGQLSQFMPYSCEEEIISKKLPIGARIDRINQSFNAIDYKTDAMFPKILNEPRASLSPDEQLKFDYLYEHLLIQGVFAAILIEEKYKKLPARVIFVYLRHLVVDGSGGTIVINITPEKVELVKSWIAKMFEDVKADNFPACNIRNPKACYAYGEPCKFKNRCDATRLCIYSI